MNLFFKIKKQDIAFATAIIESFEGVAAVRVPNPVPKSTFSILHAAVSPNFTREFEKIIKDLSKEIEIERVEK